MSMRWKLFANLAETAGEKEVEVPVEPGDTFGDAVDALLEEHPELREEILDDTGNLRDHIRVLRNDHNPFVSGEGWDTVLEEGDELALFPPVSGGRGDADLCRRRRERTNVQRMRHRSAYLSLRRVSRDDD